MNAVPAEKLDRIIERSALIEAELAAGASGETFVKLSKEYAEVEPLARQALSLRKAYGERRDLDEMSAAGGELAQMAEAEIPVIDKRIADLENDIRLSLLPKDAADERNVILEVRAGTG